MTARDRQPLLRTPLDRALILFISRSAQAYQSAPQQRQALLASFQTWMGLPVTGQADPTTTSLLALANRYTPVSQTERNLLIFALNHLCREPSQAREQQARLRLFQTWQGVDQEPAEPELQHFLEAIPSRYSGEPAQLLALTLCFQTWMGLKADGVLGPKTQGLASLSARYTARDAVEQALLAFLLRSLVSYRSTLSQRQALATYAQLWQGLETQLVGGEPSPPPPIPEEIPPVSVIPRDRAEADLLDFLRSTTQTYSGTRAQFTALVHYFQSWMGLATDGQLSPQTRRSLGVPEPLNFLNPSPQPPAELTQSDYIDAAAMIAVEPAALRAVADVESNGTGYLSDGRLKLLFEGQVFWQELADRGIDPEPLAQRHPSLIYKSWTPDYYLGGSFEYSRLELAMQIHPSAALSAASWGMFQIMGFNYVGAGFSSVEAMVSAYARSAREQLISVARWIRSRGLDHPLNHADWAAFALAYNGEGYAQNQYDLKLAERYQHWKSVGW